MKANLGWARFVHQKAIDRDRAVKGTDEVNGEGRVEYFFDKNKKSKIAHLWNDSDTFCGFLKSNEGAGRQIHTNKLERDICHACEAKWLLWNEEDSVAPKRSLQSQPLTTL